MGRAAAHGKFLLRGEERLFVCGATYGTFAPNSLDDPFPNPDVVDADLAAMAAAGANALRTYTLPPRYLLDSAQRHGLSVLVGIAWEQHVAFLADRRRAAGIAGHVRAQVAACEGHPAVLAYTLGNEIPPGIVRWHGRRRVERFLERLYRAAKAEDPQGLVTYANYPSTEYLHLPFLDLVCFNVFLEGDRPFESYLARLQNLAGDRPLLIGELGLDSRRHGAARQHQLLSAQLEMAETAGCAGAFVFSWTDEWHRGGRPVTGWEFGLNDAARRPRPALGALASAERRRSSPRVSVVVCSHNGGRTLRRCLEGVLALDYPDFECIVVDDGSTDDTAAIAAAAGVRVISTENRGLSSARNLGLEAARGEIVAYLDDDAWPDRRWLRHLADAFGSTGHAAIGGPNIPPRTEGRTADCVARAPGGPIHVLLSDTEAEHLPGCNVAFRRSVLLELGGFDPQFRVAGDDVDVCWRLQERGETLGFHAGAMVWHLRRGSVRAFLRQQFGYGRAEALLERKWPHQYNRGGHPTWGGRVYGGARGPLGRRTRIYYGRHGAGLFQQEEALEPSFLLALPATPEWYLLIAALAAATGLGAAWRPLLLAGPLLVLALGALALQAVHAAVRSGGRDVALPGPERFRRHVLTALLHALQPLARLLGRLDQGLTPWRRRGGGAYAVPTVRRRSTWNGGWEPAEAHIDVLVQRLGARGVACLRGGAFDRWDLRVRVGTLGAACLRVAVEEHGEAGQQTLYRIWPRIRGGIAAGGAAAGLGAAAALAGHVIVGSSLSLVALLVAGEAAIQAAGAVGVLLAEISPAPAVEAAREQPRVLVPDLHAVEHAGRAVAR